MKRLTNGRAALIWAALLFSGCAVMGITEAVFVPSYAVKSLIKVCLFISLPVLYFLLPAAGGEGKRGFGRAAGGLRCPPRRLILPLILGAALYFLIVGGYLLLKNTADFSGVTVSLAKNGVTRDNFIFVSLYISFVNSFLEEFFFRLFGCIEGSRVVSPRAACALSALAFALYHVSMMLGWYSIPLTAAVIGLLFVGGWILNLFAVRSGSVLAPWILHVFANFSINTVGFMLFGLLP